MSFRAVIFDAAGTLMDLRETVGETYSQFAARQEVFLSPGHLQDAFERYVASAETPPRLQSSMDEVVAAERAWWHSVVRGTFRTADGTAAFRDFETFFSELYDYYGSGKAWVLRSGASNGLSRLRESGIRVGILSNFDHRLPQILDDLGILQGVDAVVLPSNSGERKPDAAAFAGALARLAVPASDAIYVGDDPRFDLEAARLCGLRAVDVARIQSWDELPASLAALATLGETESG